MNIGDNVFYNGYHVRIVGSYSASEWVVIPIVKLQPDAVMQNTCKGWAASETAYRVRRTRCEPIASDAYTLGAVISSKLGSFRGIVSGFEPATNRVVCMPFGSEARKDRTRYAYKLTEVELANPNVVEFKPGKFYTLDDDITVFVIEAEDPTCVHFVDNTGHVIVSALPRRISKSALFRDISVTQVTMVNGW